MSDDLIRDNFAEAVDKETIKRVINIIRIVLVLCIVYSFFVAWQWYNFLSTASRVDNAVNGFYKFTLFPIISFCSLAVKIAGLFLNLKGTKLVYSSFINEEGTLFNLGYKLIYKSALITVITFAIEITIWIIRILLKM